MDPAVLAEFDAAMTKVANNPEFQAELAKLKYKAVDMGSAESKDFIYDKREISKLLIDAAPSLDDITG